MDKFIEIFHNLVTQSMNQIYETVVKHGPGVAFAISIIIFGWICALVIKKVISKLLKALGFNILIDKTGLKRILDRGEIKQSPSTLVGLIFYWIILLNTLIVASDAVDLELTSQFIQQAILYIPKIIVVVVFISIANFIGRFIYNVVEKMAHVSNIPLCKLLGNIARYTVIGLAAMMVLDYLQLAINAMIQSFVVIFVVVPVCFFIAFLVGGRVIISSILARQYLLKEYKKGDVITFDTISGEIVAIDAIYTKLRSGDEEIIVSNSQLADKVIKKKI